jgi:hypothetical protein
MKISKQTEKLQVIRMNEYSIEFKNLSKLILKVIEMYKTLGYLPCRSPYINNVPLC